MGPTKSSKPSQAKAETGPWDWAEKITPDKVGLTELRKAYRIIGFCVCKTQCRRNCKRNPKCLWGLGERKWLKEEDKTGADEETSDLSRNEGQLVGIQNLGATCYVNSLLQLWFHNPILRPAILAWKPPTAELEDPENYVPKCPIGHLQAMFARLKLSKQCSIDPSPFVMALELNAGEQQDAQEFSKLLMTLIDELFAKYQNQNVRTVIKDSFTGECQYETECSVCKTKTVSASVFNELELTVNKQLSESIAQYLQAETLDGPNQYNCSTCKSKQDALRSTKLKKLPPILNLQLMRFVYDMETQRKKKVSTLMRFPEELDMTDHIAKEFRSGKKLVYKLTAVLIHNGKSASSGHYVAHIKDIGSGAWYDCNDESVEKKPMKKSQALVISDAENSELPNGTNGGPKEQSQKIKSHSSTGAYMLVYTLRDLHDKPPADPEIHKYLVHLVGREDAVFEADLAKTKAEKESKDKKREDKQKEIQKLYEWYKIQALGRLLKQNSEDNEATVAGPSVDSTKEEIEFFPASWLSNWLSDKNENEEGNNAEVNTDVLRCVHGNLSPSPPSDNNASYKIVPVSFVDSVYAKYGGAARLQGEQVLCLECVKQQCGLIQKLAKLEEDYKQCMEMVRQVDKAVGNPPWTNDFLQDKVWISKDGLRCCKKYAKEAIQVSSLVLGMEEEPFILNEDITCPHGKLEPSENSRKLISITAWSILEPYFPGANCFAASEPCCKECFEIQKSNSVTATENKATAQKQKAALTDLFNNKSRPHPYEEEGMFYLVPTKFVEKWRKFVRNPTSVTHASEIRVENRNLLCEHDMFRYPLALIKDVISGQGQGTPENIVTVVKPEEWTQIKEHFDFDQEIEMKRGFERTIYTPEICEECSAAWFGEAIQKALNYNSAEIYVEKLETNEADRSSPEPESNKNNGFDRSNIPFKKERKDDQFYNGEIRRSTRARHTAKQKRYHVSSNVTLREFQLKLMSDYKAMLSDQHIYYEGKELTDRDLTLGEHRVKPGAVLRLKVDESKGDDEHIEESPVQERGFSGTVLQGYTSQVPMEH